MCRRKTRALAVTDPKKTTRNIAAKSERWNAKELVKLRDRISSYSTVRVTERRMSADRWLQVSWGFWYLLRKMMKYDRQSAAK